MLVLVVQLLSALTVPRLLCSVVSAVELVRLTSPP
jgi:hypothetical protein